MTQDQPLLELKSVAKSYSAVGEGPELKVLRCVTLSVGPGEKLAIVGPSGCGKSTLLNLMGGLDRPTSGGILLEGRDLSDMTDAELAFVRNRRIGFVFQLHHLLPQCTVLENVLLPTLASRDGAQWRQAAEWAGSLLGRVGLGDRLSHRPGQLSGGEQQRVAAVRAMINSPAVVLADEPTGSLDRKSAGELADLLVELGDKEGSALVVVTHSMEIARRMGRVLELCDGTLAEEKDPE